jgi:DNA-binding CsgD family transcriptional regulator
MADILSQAYDVASGTASWLDVARALSDLLGGRRTVLFLLDARSDSVELLAGSTPNLKSVPERFVAIARRHGRRLKARLPGPALVGAGRSRPNVSAVDDLAGWCAALETDQAFVGGHLLASAQSSYLCLACGPDEPGERLEPVDGAGIDMMLRHIARAAEVVRWLDTATAQLHAVSQVLDRFPVGIIQLDRNGAVTELNAAALRIAQVQNGLTITTAGVHAVTESDEARLQKAIEEAIAHRGGDFVKRLSIRRRNGVSSGVVVSSIDRHRGVARNGQSCCVLFVIDAEARHDLEPEAIVDLLGLTLAEARVVAALAMGTSLAEASTQLGITINTSRTLLSRAMSKTGTNSQIGVVRLVLTALLPLSAEL